MSGSAEVAACEGLGFRYRRTTPWVFDGLDASFGVGTVTAVVGRSGCGKSTLLYLLGLLLRPGKGAVRWRGTDTSTLDDTRRSAIRAREIGFVFQDAVLDLSRSVRDNILEGALYAGMDLAAADREARAMAAELDLPGRLDDKPGSFSGGQAQRVAVCRALIKRPALVLADEPTGNLDAESAEIVWERLLRSREHAAIVVATHDLDLAARADTVVRLPSPAPAHA